MMHDLDSYLSGIFDGEGYITAYYRSQYKGRKRYTRLLVGVGMTDRRIPELFQERFGGSVKTYKTKSKRLMHQWYRCGSNAREALEIFSSLCIVKQEEAKLALELAGHLFGHKIKGKRALGSQMLTNKELRYRQKICDRICFLKRAS